MSKKKNEVTSTRHILPFGNLSSEDFSRLCYWIVERSEQFDSVQYYDMTGDKNRDVIGYKHGKTKREQWYFQCKRYKRISFAVLKKELDEIKVHSEAEEHFKPDVIIFVVGCTPSPSCKDNTVEYARELGFGQVYFWADVELDEKAKATDGVLSEFFRGGINTQKLAEEVAERVTMSLKMGDRGPVGVVEALTSKTDAINREISEAARLIDEDDSEEAKRRLYVVLEKVRKDPAKYSNELGRIYNNLGVCFIRTQGNETSLDTAAKYFELASEANPELSKAAANLASVLLRKGAAEDVARAYEIANDLWEKSDKDDPQQAEILIWSTWQHKSPAEAIELYEESEECKALVSRTEQLMYEMAMVYVEAEDFDKAERLVNSALDISPSSPQVLSLKAKILMLRSQRECVIPSTFEIVPRFRDYQGIEMALGVLHEALENAEEVGNRRLSDKIKIDILLCLLWLRRADDARYAGVRSSIEVGKLTSEERDWLRKHDFAAELECRNFETAYNLLIQASDWSTASYSERIRLAQMFLVRGGPRQANRILAELESEADQSKDVQFWMDVSINEALLNNKNLAIKAAQKARDVSTDTPEEKRALSHFNALMLRYARAGESDRFVEGAFEYDRRYPEEGTIRAVQALDSEGQPTEEIIAVLRKQRDWYNGVKESFRTQQIPSYFLEMTFKRPYADILSFRDDPEFVIDLTIPDKQFEKDLAGNLDDAKVMVFDYASLLNLSKMNLLGHLPRFGRRLVIAEELFEKVQQELIVVEQPDLRKLWDFLRSSKEIDLMVSPIVDLNDRRLSEALDEWLTGSMMLAKRSDTVFVVDDLRLLRLLGTEEIRGCNTPIILKHMLGEEWIDQKIYAESLGDLAERFYVFLAFTGDDLFRIVMEDNSRITLRSLHLVNQLFLNGAIPASFTSVFLRFVGLLWRTGSLAEEKVRWLAFLTHRILELISRQGGVQNREELDKVAPDFALLWVTAIKMSNKDELALIEEKLDEVLGTSGLLGFRDFVAELLAAKKKDKH